MKQVLLGGTALAAAALIGAMPASAADANVTSGLQLKITGFVAAQSALVLTDTQHSDFDRDYDFQTNARMQFDVKNVTDSGLEYGGRIRFDSVNRRDGVLVDRTYVYVKGDFGTITFGDGPTVADDFGYVYAHDELAGAIGAGGMDFGDLLDGDFPLGGGNFYSIDATYLGGLANDDTRIKYTSPTINGFSFGVDFTPVVGGSTHAGPGGRNDLINDSSTLYENVVTGGVGWDGDIGGDVDLRLAATAAYGNGVSTDNNPEHHDLEAYTLGGRVKSGGIAASVNWTHYSTLYLTDKSVDTVIGDLSYQWGPFLTSVSYAYTWAGSNNGLTQPYTGATDLQDNHIAGVNLTYTLAPGLNTYAEVIYEKQNFREGKDFENANLLTGINLAF
ncbi:MAG: porin [Inquilinus sp.]|uniref:porin n=1 Tax=Inquilinus sp. TaxID=1932117 RepID=UPI003F31B0E4